MQLLFSILIFFVAAGYIFGLLYFALAPLALLKALAIPMVIMLIILYRSSITSLKAFLVTRVRWFLLFWVTVFLQLLVVSTGGIQSPLLILIHVFMVGLSFTFSFTISLMFLLFSFAVILIELAMTQNIQAFIAEHPTSILLQLASLIPIVAISYIVSQQYRLKDMVSTMLGIKIKTDEAILERLNELIIVTDPGLTILSVNDAVERTLQRSRSEMLNTALFTTLLLRDKEGKVVDKSFFYPDGKTFQMLHTFLDDCTLINSVGAQKKMVLQVQPIEAVDGTITQISFIFSFKQKDNDSAGDSLPIGIERTRGKYEAISENLRNKFSKENNSEDLQQIILMRTIETDIFMLQSLKNDKLQAKDSRIDISQLCRQTVSREQDFAKIFQVPLSFKTQKIGKEITDFTVACDVQKVGFLVQKLLDFLVLLASSKTNGQVQLLIEANNDTILIKTRSDCPPMSKEDRTNLYVPYYGSLATKTNLQAGSGLDGYLIKTLIESLDMDVPSDYTETPSSTISFTLKFQKKA